MSQMQIELSDKKTFINLLGSLFSKIDELACDDKINSNEYLEFATLVKQIADLRKEVKTTTVYTTIERQARRAYMKPKVKELDKFKDDNNYTNCKFCDKRIAVSYITYHLSNSITCNRVRQTKQNVVVSKKRYIPKLYSLCQAYNTQLLNRYKPIKNIDMTMQMCKILDIDNKLSLINTGNNYEKINNKWVLVE